MIIIYLLITGLLAGILGALLGLGGGVIMIPALTILFKLPIHTAIGISLVGVIATSTGAAIANFSNDRIDTRLAMLLELATTVGAVIGALVSGYINAKTLYLLFAVVLIYNAYSMYRKAQSEASVGGERVSQTEGPDRRQYYLRNVPAGFAFSGIAGVMSGLLGIGGGLIKIPVMHFMMGVPLKTATATSNFMIGITATASAFIYYLNGEINPMATVPVALGIFAGANIGSRLNRAVSVRTLRRIFVIVFFYVSVQMILKGIRS